MSLASISEGKVIGFVCEGKMRGAAELSPLGSARAPVFDETVSGKGLGGRGSGPLWCCGPFQWRAISASHIRVEGLRGNERLRRTVAQFDVDML